jgi:hypothetical protein
LEEQRRVIAAQQAEAEHKQRMEIYPLEIQEKDLAIRKREQDLNGAMGEYSMAQEALVKGINPKTGQPLTDTEARELRARLAQATLAINAEATKVAQEKEKHEKQIKVYDSQIAENNAQAASANAARGMGAFKQKATIQIPDLTAMDRPTTYEVGTQNGFGQVKGNDGNLYNNVNEAARAQGIGAPADGAPATTAAPAAEKTEAEPDFSLLPNWLTNKPQAGAPAQSPAFILQLQTETDELMLGKRKAYSPAVQAYLDKHRELKHRIKAKQDEYKRQEQERMLQGNR